MRWRPFIATGVLGLMLAFAPTASAASSSSDEEEVSHDARTEGYETKPQIEKNSTIMTWVLFSVLSVIMLGTLFKDAKRTHLD